MIVASHNNTMPTVVLHVRVVTGAGGGPEKTILRSPRYLRGRGYDELCAYLRPPNDRGFAAIEARARAADAELIAIDDRGPLDWRVVSQLVALCRERGVTVWHGHDYKSNLLGILVKRFVPLRLVTTVHGWVRHTWRTPLYYWLDRCSLRYYERVICVSPDLTAACQRAGVAAERCLTLDNAIEVDAYRRRRSPADAKAALGLPPASQLIGAIGRLSPEKGFDLLIEAFRRLAGDYPQARLAILGEGPEHARLAAQIAATNLGDRAQLVGHSNQVPDWLEAMNVFALSSLREGLPNVLLEAMALETPVVATCIAGVPRLVENNVNGLLIPPGDVDALQTGMMQLLENPPRAAELASAGRATICRDFDFACRMEKMRAIYDELLTAT